ncbi:hypothetical protein Ddye_009825 [Dipteronia dyeriana]|uniref:Reverse transcriptase domain-containing protein n=1 Tax=Dipteronia dyeriana TaxID=168575 RepID=A0AAE0CN82_9ROSI|nr:hypothetical protein Ddye_009825 [Dipteronia dyeriana]
MSKAYDRVEWCFLERILLKLGFSELWMRRVMGCVNSVSYSFLINGNVCGFVRPSRGHSQEDPMSLYLYLLVNEGLSNLLHVTVEQGVCRGFRCDRSGPMISHLFFADDTLLFTGASAKDCLAIRNILGVYSRASGQQVNFEKSSMCVSKGISSSVGDRLARLICVQHVRCLDRYLGIPDFASKNKKQLHKDIKERVWNRIRGWQGKLMSIGGREVLIKAVIQSIPTYSMSLFRLPRNLLNELHGLCNHFWWGSKVTKETIHWAAWDKLCRGKDIGGMGFKNLINFNRALLAKQVWRLIKNPGSLAARVLKHLYFCSCFVLEAEDGRKGSYLWHSLCWSRSLIDAGSRWRIGCGSGLVSIYNDK